jgi:hypothetical protein
MGNWNTKTDLFFEDLGGIFDRYGGKREARLSGPGYVMRTISSVPSAPSADCVMLRRAFLLLRINALRTVTRQVSSFSGIINGVLMSVGNCRLLIPHTGQNDSDSRACVSCIRLLFAVHMLDCILLLSLAIPEDS